MSERIWDRFLTESDKALLAAGNFGQRAGFGKRPAVLVIDATYGFCGDRPEPVMEAIKRWPTSCGQAAWDAIPVIKTVIDKCHHKGVPVIYTHGVRRADNWDSGSWRWKVAAETGHGPSPRHDEIVSPLEPSAQDVLISKRKPSAFFGTDLVAFLNLLQCDSLIITGATTSGCVRATVLDAFSLNYRVALVEDGCFDRLESSHAIHLCEMHAKYADVASAKEVLSYLEQIESGLFSLPSGMADNKAYID